MDCLKGGQMKGFVNSLVAYHTDNLMCGDDYVKIIAERAKKNIREPDEVVKIKQNGKEVEFRFNKHTH